MAKATAKPLPVKHWRCNFRFDDHHRVILEREGRKRIGGMTAYIEELIDADERRPKKISRTVSGIA
jgi:hypothetical protein